MTKYLVRSMYASLLHAAAWTPRSPSPQHERRAASVRLALGTSNGQPRTRRLPRQHQRMDARAGATERPRPGVSLINYEVTLPVRARARFRRRRATDAALC